MDAHFWWAICMLSIIGNLFLIGYYRMKHDECNAYKEKASYWLEAYNKLSLKYMNDK